MCLFPVKRVDNYAELSQYPFEDIATLLQPYLLLFDSVLNDFGFLALKVIVLRQKLSQRIVTQGLLLGQTFDRPFAGCADVVRQPRLQVDGPVRLCAG